MKAKQKRKEEIERKAAVAGEGREGALKVTNEMIMACGVCVRIECNIATYWEESLCYLRECHQHCRECSMA